AGDFLRVDSDSLGTFGCDDHNNIDVLNNNGGPLDVVYSGAYNNSYAPGTSSGGWHFGMSSAIDDAGEGSSGVAVTEFAFDADNHPDVVVLNQYFTTAGLWAGNGMGAFSEIATIEGCAGVNGASGSRYAAAGDLDGEGSIDLVITCMQGNFAIVHGSADSTFAAPIEVLLPGAHEPMLVDIDGDADLDIVVTSTTQEAVMVYLVDGGVPDEPIELAMPGTPRGVAVGDLDEDGAMEIVVAVDGAAGSGVAIVRTDP
ncbi:MAG TPA: VCBS repeat-containing protein, partial [Nannocystaceae bacterium]|nr:VCBS repeat-containing protein [Nannocystaceae bacterium]